MSTRTNKRRISQLLYCRFYGKFLWMSAEEKAWLDCASVGWEFGISSLEELHQQMLAADLVIPLTADGGKNDRSNGVES